MIPGSEKRRRGYGRRRSSLSSEDQEDMESRRTASGIPLEEVSVPSQVIGQRSERLRRSSSISEVSAYFDDLSSAYFQGSSPPATILISDNHSTHGEIDRGLMPSLDDYDPLDDFLPSLLGEQGVQPRDVTIIVDDPNSDDTTVASLPSLSYDDLQRFSSALRLGNTEILPASSQQEATQQEGLDSVAMIDQSQQRSPANFEDSMASVDISNQLLSPVKEISPNSVLDAFPPTSIQKIEPKLFALQEKSEKDNKEKEEESS